MCCSLLLCGCSERAGFDPASKSIQITPSILTRVSSLNFDTGDCIGLSVVRTSGNYVENHPMTYRDSHFTDESLTWYDDGSESSTFMAYYPYAEAGIAGGFSVATDQRAGCTSSDLLGALRREVTPTAEPVKMVFYHLLSQLEIVVNNDSSSSVSEVSVSGFVPTAEVDLASLSAMAAQEVPTAGITAFEVTADQLYRVILVPQRAPLTVTVRTADGNTQTKTISEAALEGGRRYDLSVTLTDRALDVSLSGEIGDWEEGGTLLPDDSDEDPVESGTTEQPGSMLEYEGEIYATTVIDGMTWMAENLRYLPDASEIGSTVWYPEAGEEAVAELGLLYSYAVVMNGSPASDSPVQGICPSGWHVPTTAELESLMAAVSADFITDSGYYNSDNGQYQASNTAILIGCELDGADCQVLKKKDGTMSISAVSVKNGMSLRCVKD